MYLCSAGCQKESETYDVWSAINGAVVHGVWIIYKSWLVVVRHTDDPVS